MHIRAEIPQAGPKTRVWLDDKEITHHLQSFRVDADVFSVTKVKLGLVPKHVLIEDADPSIVVYTGVNGEQLIPLADATHVWHCQCGTWNRMYSGQCRDCFRDRPEQASDTVEFEVAFRFDIKKTEKDIGDVAMETLKKLARNIPPHIWEQFRVFVENRTYMEAERAKEKAAACAPSDSTPSSESPVLPFSATDPVPPVSEKSSGD